MSKENKWLVIFISGFISGLLGIAIFVVFIDPYFHYHKALNCLSYSLRPDESDPPDKLERYINNGIVRNFDYDAIITGTSMAQNFKTTEFDEYFQCCSVKTCFSGGSYKEVNDNLKAAIEANSQIKIIFRCLDYSSFMVPSDYMRHEKSFYPTYLYDQNPLNDVKYIFNKEVLLGAVDVIRNTIENGENLDFDNYGNWMKVYPDFGKDVLNTIYKRPEKTEIKDFSVEDKSLITENITENVVKLIAQNPQIQFYLYFPPYSIYWWDQVNQEGTLEKHLAAEKEVIKILVQYENVHLFSFFDDFELICDLNNYRDIIHYSEWINSYILNCMANGEHQVTKENCREYCFKMEDFIQNMIIIHYLKINNIDCILGLAERE